MKHAYKAINFRGKSAQMIDTLNAIIDDYLSQGLKLTLRQLYYQCVSRDLIPNSEKSYKQLGALISNARLAGLMDWYAIEDRGRQPRAASDFENLSELAEAAIHSYRLPRWRGQAHYAELWVEKEALSGVLSPLARKFHVVLMVNKGYSSQSSMFESAQRFIHAGREGRELSLFYLGDHDPSGEDMVRDIKERLDMFGEGSIDIRVQKLALTMAQVKKYNPPPNPAKITDSRAAAYIEKFGEYSWEVDALPPTKLAEIITKAFEGIVDHAALNRVLEQEDADKAKLRKAVAQLMKRT